MPVNAESLSESDVRKFLHGLAFVREFAIDLVFLAPGAVTIDLPFSERFSGPPSLFPAAMVGVAGDVAAAASCLSLVPKGWGVATLDFTVKMAGMAKGEKLRARGRVLNNGRTNSIGAADIYAVIGDEEKLCGALLATTRNFEIRS